MRVAPEGLPVAEDRDYGVDGVSVGVTELGEEPLAGVGVDGDFPFVRGWCVTGFHPEQPGKFCGCDALCRLRVAVCEGDSLGLE